MAERSLGEVGLLRGEKGSHNFPEVICASNERFPRVRDLSSRLDSGGTRAPPQHIRRGPVHVSSRTPAGGMGRTDKRWGFPSKWDAEIDQEGVGAIGAGCRSSV